MKTPETSRSVIVQSLTELLNGGHAHVSFSDAVAGIPQQLIGAKHELLPYTIWQLVEHIRIAQWDIVEFSSNKDHVSPSWPDEYWPKEPAPARSALWEESLSQIKADRETFIALLHDTTRDLFHPFPYGEGQHLFREALLIADHTSYHTGEILVLRRLLKCW